MSAMFRFARGALVAAGLAAFGAMSCAAATPATSSDPATDCFLDNQWHGWTAPSPDVLYLGVNLHDVYKAQLSLGAPELQWPQMQVVSEIRGGYSICGPVDLELSVTDGHGYRKRLIVTSLTKLSPAEVAAIPRKFRPD
jgi:hypothetical protein